ncbi:LuxR C-terminal-related transcriptional regulator [Flagellimonas flava]|uniref:Two component transcriptional regulator, LuxR family n=1 Tax=Flagellimonas flava TaxID=570519 RepID=A0A1M5IC72_9FLAO|nr:response regulator transcription factor [Allomuricauda flava]SHG25861.1 two component transcriptional regulator, LuxR family [Allomuricauda flava]
MKTSPLKIAIVDHDEKLHPLYRFYFSDHDEYELVGIHTSINRYMCHTSGNAIDIVVCEVQLTGLSGIDGIPYFHKKSNVPQILMTSQKCDFKIIKEAFKKGASGFLTKPLTKSRFFNALDELNEHGIALEHDVAKKIIHSFQSKSYERFSKKENQIIELLTQGYTYKMIADRLCVTPSAVNFHIQNIYVKLNVNSKAEALKKLQELEVRQLNAA